VLVNANATSPIIIESGLRQGDPLSPYLFIICVECLFALFQKAEALGEINGVKICNNSPIISHLLFADDCFLFFRANVDQENKMRDILSTYERASGQAVNLKKSEIFCSRNVLTKDHNNYASILGVQVVLVTGNIWGFLL